MRGMRPKIHMLTPVLLAGPARTYLEKCLAIQPTHLLAYWTLSETSGTTIGDASGNGRTGVYMNTPTLGEAGIGDGLTAALFDQTQSEYGNVYSAGLSSAFDGAEGTMAAWIKVSAVGVWTDGAYHYAMNLGADSNNRIWYSKTSTNNIFQLGYRAGGTIKATNASFSSTGWFHAAITWSKSADQAKCYLNGAQVGGTMTGLGVWAGSLANGWCLLMCDQTPRYFFPGWMAHAAVWKVPLAAGEIASLAEVN